MILAVAGINRLSVSCGGYVPLTDEALEQAQNHQFRAGPEEVTDAVMEVFVEMDNPFDMYIERTSETSALAERTALLYMLISSSINNCRFVFKAEPGPDGGTDANLAITRQGQLLFSQPGKPWPYEAFTRALT